MKLLKYAGLLAAAVTLAVTAASAQSLQVRQREAQDDAQALLKLFNTDGKNIVNIYRAGALRPGRG